MSQLNPAIVEAIKRNNGWKYDKSSGTWVCVVGDCYARQYPSNLIPTIGSHNSDCPCHSMFTDDAHPTNCACPDCEPDEHRHIFMAQVCNKIDAIHDRLDALESKPATPEQGTHTVGDDNLYVFLEGKKIPMLSRFIRPELLKELAGASIDYQLYCEYEPTDILMTGLSKIDTSLHQSFYAVPPCTMASPSSKPKCERCGDTKIIRREADQRSNPGASDWSELCSCLKVGDAVSAEVANMLPVGSRIRGSGWSLDAGAYWIATDKGWDGVSGGDTKPTTWAPRMLSSDWTILRIGPAPVAPPPDDICERWQQAWYDEYDLGMMAFLRKQGLPEMAAVCEAVAEVGDYPPDSEEWGEIRAAGRKLSALSAKEAVNGEA